jgi:hypothetical protein
MVPSGTLALAFAALLLAGCAAAPTEAYHHDWSYGPGYSLPDRDPLFDDNFTVAGAGALAVTIDWTLRHGDASVVLTPPGGAAAVNLTSGGQAHTTHSVPGASGTWRFQIPTWRGVDGAFPEGRVAVSVRQ